VNKLNQIRLDRAAFLRGAVALSAATLIGARFATRRAQALPATPSAVDEDDAETPAETEGPYFTPGSPENAVLVTDDMAGTRLNLSGTVIDPTGAPVAAALLDFWQANDSGEYDNTGYTLRGHQYTDANGAYALATIVPGLYPGRTRHIHVKVQAPNGPLLTTQLYVPGEPRNDSDSLFMPALLMTMQQQGDGSETATFTFVIATS
jgi:protocatechuate 3,4-dioxygenase beta subunit